MESKLDECTCPKCGSSWPSAAAKNRHLRAHGKNNTFESTIDHQEEVTDEIENDMDVPMLESFSEEPMPIFGNIMDNLVSPFEEITDEFSQ